MPWVGMKKGEQPPVAEPPSPATISSRSSSSHSRSGSGNKLGGNHLGDSHSRGNSEDRSRSLLASRSRTRPRTRSAGYETISGSEGGREDKHQTDDDNASEYSISSIRSVESYKSGVGDQMLNAMQPPPLTHPSDEDDRASGASLSSSGSGWGTELRMRGLPLDTPRGPSSMLSTRLRGFHGGHGPSAVVGPRGRGRHRHGGRRGWHQGKG